MKNSKIYPWIVVGLLWGVALLNYMDRQMLSTMKDAMQVDIVELQSATNFGYLMAIFLWIYALMSPVSGVIADRLNRKWLIVGSLFVWSSVTYLMGIAETFNQVVWLRALMGVSEALYIPAGLSLIADYHTGKSRSLAVGIHMTGLYTGQAIGVLIGGPLSDKWVQKNLRGRVYTGAIGLGLTIPSLLLLGFGHNLVAVVGAGLLFGIGYGIFDTNNMPILCQFVSHKQRATAYGVMNMIGVSAGAFITHLLGRWGDSGNLGAGFAMLAIVVAIALGVQLYFLRPKTDNME